MQEQGVIFNKPPPRSFTTPLRDLTGEIVSRTKAVTKKITHLSKSVATDEAQKQEAKFQSLVNKSDECLYRLSSVFPFDFFPDEITIENNQINIIIHIFFLCSHIQSIPIKNVADVFIESGPFFAVLKIIDRSYIENSVSIKFLKKHEAFKAREVIQGLIVASSMDVDISQIPLETIKKDVHNLGRATGVKRSF